MQLAIRKSNNEVMNDRQSGKLSLAAIASQFGGIAEDYKLIEVPSEQKSAAIRTRFISYDGQNLNIDERPLLQITDMQITVTAGWVRGNERLTNDVVMDIPLDSENNRELEIEIVKDDVTEDIEVVKYLWLETEDKGDLPTGKSFISSILKMSIPAGTTDLTEVL
jgi:hypothetical protein